MSNISDSGELNSKMWAAFMEKTLEIDDTSWKFVYAGIMIFIFVTSLSGNLLTCFVIYFDKSMHTATNYYLFNLAASDLMLTFAVLIQIYDHLIDEYNQLLCLIEWFSVGCLWNNSILTMTTLAIERYIAIWHPMMLKSTPVWRRVVKIIALLWLLAILETAPEMLIVDVIKTRRSTVCFTVHSKMARIMNGVLAILTFVIPLIIMTFVYSTIVFKVNSKRKKNSRDKIFNYRNPRSKINKLMIAMTVSFFVCWTPFFILRMFIALLDVEQFLHLSQWWCVLFQVVNINSWFSSVLNPILFSLMSTKFRKSLKFLWNSKIRRPTEVKQRSPSGRLYKL